MKIETLIIQKLFFRIRILFSSIISSIRIIILCIQGSKIGNRCIIGKVYYTWPHQISIGNNCNIEHGVFFKFDGVWKNGPKIILRDKIFIGSNVEFNIRQGINVGENTLIASGARLIDHDHGVNLGELIKLQQGPEKPIIIGEDVWIGCNVVVLKGVEIGDGAIVAAGAVVSKSINKNEIWAGVPARKIGERRLI